MQIKVCGFNDAQSISAVSSLDIEMIGMEFRENVAKHISNIITPAGTTIDKPFFRLVDKDDTAFYLGKSIEKIPGKKYVGVFADQSPQHLISCAYNYNFDFLQLNGNETSTYLKNFRSSVIPDILPEIKIIKTLFIGNDNELPDWHEYEGLADMLNFEFTAPCAPGVDRLSAFNNYDGTIPFLISGIVSPPEIMRTCRLSHPLFLGINIYYESHHSFTPADLGRIAFVIDKIRGRK